MAYGIQKITATASLPSASWLTDAYLDAPVLSSPADEAAFCPPFSPFEGAQTGIQLNWEAVTGAAFYVVQLSQGDQSFQGPLSQGIRTSNTYLDLRYLTHIRINQPIYWRVYAYTLVGGASIASSIRKVTLACPDFNGQGAAAANPGAVSPISCDSLGSEIQINGETTLGFGDTGRYTVDISYDCEHYEGSDVDVTSITWSTKVPDGHRIFTNTPIHSAKSQNYYDVAVEKGPVPYAFSLTCEVTFTAVKNDVTTGTATCSKTINVTVGGQAEDKGLIWVRNDFAFVLPAYSPVGIDMAIQTDNLTQDVYSEGRYAKYNHHHTYSCTKPEPRHVGRWAVLQHELKPGEIGPAVVSGNSVVRVPESYGASPLYTQNQWQFRYTNPFYDSSRNVFPSIEFDGIYGSYGTGAEDTGWLRGWFLRDHVVLQAGTNHTASNYFFPNPSGASLTWPAKASLFDVRGSFYEPGGCAGSVTFGCVEGKYVELNNTCQEGCSGWMYPELSAQLSLVGFADAYGMSLPCSPDESLTLPCRHDGSTGEITISREEGFPRPEECEMRRICTYECQPSGGGYDWVKTHDCVPTRVSGENRSCHCPTLDPNIWPCTANSEPRLATMSCRTVLPSTTTVTGTSTSAPPCSGTCTVECKLVGYPTAYAYVWVASAVSCNGGGSPCSCPVSSIYGPAGITGSSACDPADCGQVVTVNCIAKDTTTTTADPFTTTSTPGTSTTGTNAPCSGTTDWTCVYTNALGLGYEFRWVLDPNFVGSGSCTTTCCRFAECPSGPCCDFADVGSTESTNCTATITNCSRGNCPTTTSSSTTTGDPSTTTTESTTTSAYPCACTEVGKVDCTGGGSCVYLWNGSGYSLNSNNCVGAGATCDLDPFCSYGGGTPPQWVSTACCCDGTTTTGAPTTTTVSPSSTTTVTGSSSSPPTTTTSAAPCTGSCEFTCGSNGGGGVTWLQISSTCANCEVGCPPVPDTGTCDVPGDIGNTGSGACY